MIILISDILTTENLKNSIQSRIVEKKREDGWREEPNHATVKKKWIKDSEEWKKKGNNAGT